MNLLIISVALPLLSLLSLLSFFFIPSYAVTSMTIEDKKTFKLFVENYKLPSKWSKNDADMDGLTDAVEKKYGSSPYLFDTDGDGLHDGIEVGYGKRALDTDNDGRPNFNDQDDDNDGIPTVLESRADTDNDYDYDYLDSDSDGDGLNDGMEVTRSFQDNDQDTIDDAFDVDYTQGIDRNGDGIDDTILLRDSDKDGIPDVRDTDLVRSNSLAYIQKIRNQNNQRHIDLIAKKRLLQNKKTTPLLHTVAGFFYCVNTNKIMSNIQDFTIQGYSTTYSSITQPVVIKSNGSNGDYLWQTKQAGIYSINFSLPKGLEIAGNKPQVRRIVNAEDRMPLVLGVGEDINKRGYLVNTKQTSLWFLMFELLPKSHSVINNNIPLTGALCNE